MKKIVKVYDRAFKVKAVLLSFQRNSIEPVEKELGITNSLLNRWRQDYQKYGIGSFPGCGNLRLGPEQKKIYLLEKRIAKAELHSQIIKNSAPYLSQGRPLIFFYIQSCEKTCSAKQICSILCVDQRCYSSWKNQYVSDTKKHKLALMQEITSVFFAMKKRYGYMRIAAELRKRGINISHTTTARYMKELGLYVSIKKP